MLCLPHPSQAIPKVTFIPRSEFIELILKISLIYAK
jgi:hypothetical protein